MRGRVRCLLACCGWIGRRLHDCASAAIAERRGCNGKSRRAQDAAAAGTGTVGSLPAHVQARERVALLPPRAVIVATAAARSIAATDVGLQIGRSVKQRGRHSTAARGQTDGTDGSSEAGGADSGSAAERTRSVDDGGPAALSPRLPSPACSAAASPLGPSTASAPNETRKEKQHPTLSRPRLPSDRRRIEEPPRPTESP